MAQHNELGTWGEDYASSLLVKKGYVILERDWHLGKRDIDIVSRTEDGRTLVFVEVKTREQDTIMSPLEAVNVQKMKSIGFCANAYVKMNNLDCEVRFDVISIVKTADIKVEHIEDAFNPCLL